ncbi:DedA family protein [Nocardiopsis sp. ATB16-24]|uniref:DedA family protein n=1 Tax=Nocardiopsis sp. ATB16-24 TaxID=3019555 RepID=UPI002554A120|nr:DedA family protein [Nocardiopsis sp. ATB16-24]
MGGWEQWFLAVPTGVVYLVAFALPFAEAAVFAGLVVPGETGLLLAGVVAGLGHADPFVVGVCGIAGAVAGDSVGFEIGRRLGPRLTTGRLGRVIGPARWERAEGFVRRYGAHAVFLGRWVGFARALVPALAGATGLGYRRFVIWNALSGAVWASTITLVGYLAGDSWQRVERVLGEAVLLVVLVGAAALVTVIVARWIARHPERVRAWASRQADRRGVRRVLARYDRQVRWLARRFEPRTVLGLELTMGVVLVVAAGWFFGAVLQDVIVGEEAVRSDGPVLRWFAAHRAPEITTMLVSVNHLAGVWGGGGPGRDRFVVVPGGATRSGVRREWVGRRCGDGPGRRGPGRSPRTRAGVRGGRGLVAGRLPRGGSGVHGRRSHRAGLVGQ